MPNPFFSGRIPPDLLERVEKHCAETGETKTDVLVHALSTYLNHPIAPRNNPVVEVSKEMFTTLEERVATLENLLIRCDNSIIKFDNKEKQNEGKIIKQLVISPDNKTEISEIPEDFWAAPLNNTNNTFDKNKEKIKGQNKEPTLLLSEHIPKKLENLTSSELIKSSDLKQSQLDGYKRRVLVKYKKMEQPLEKKQLLSIPEKIETKNLTVIDGYPYDLFYLGENENGNSLWSAIPYDNKRYQQLSMQISSEENLS